MKGDPEGAHADCLDPEDLHAWVSGAASDEARARALAHVATCESCREQASALARSEPTPPPDGSSEGSPDGSTGQGAVTVGARVGRFVVAQILGRGGMGVVVRAHDAELGRDVAIKVVRPDAAARARLGERLVREAKALAALRHENLVTVYEIGTHDGAPFVVMELVRGQTLRAHATEPGRKLTEVLDACLRAGRGLAALHDAGFVHRDVKPDNVLVAEDGRVVLVDLGLARRVTDEAASDAPGSKLTRTGAIVGTPRYLAPELLAGATADVRADVYALAVTIREALAACADGAIPPRVRAALVRAQDPDPAMRHPTVGALLEDLDRGRRPRVAIAGLVLGALLVVGVGGAMAARREAPPEPTATIATAMPTAHDAPAPPRPSAPRLEATPSASAAPQPTASARATSSASAVPSATAPPSMAMLALGEPMRPFAPGDEPPLAALSASGPSAGFTTRPLPDPMTIPFFQHMQWDRATAALADETIRTGDACKSFVKAPTDPLDAVPLDVEWGTVERRERVEVENEPGKKQIDWLYQVKGREGRFVFSGFGEGRYLDVAVGEQVVFCPKHERTGVLPTGFEGRFVFVKGYGGPVAGAPTSSTRKPRPRWIPRGPTLVDDAWPFGEGPLLFRVVRASRASTIELPSARVEMGTYYFDVVNDAARDRLKKAGPKQPLFVVAHFTGEQERDGTRYPVLTLDEILPTLFQAPKPTR